MSKLMETIKFFRSYGVKCDEKSVEEWLSNTSSTEDVNNQVCEGDLYNFNDWCRRKGTAYEEGIDDQLRIARLLEDKGIKKRNLRFKGPENRFGRSTRYSTILIH
ncbi:hypothetical protein [Paraliobacillus ryukyuensis]|uniref:hypothetical protein n=1 Tax=Paraliobacillus ryukyuensis TaxID=200904 RepID=UPI0009A5F6FB|nr:hypothetical protein [Paraliobacillus ryukyuensis]